MSQEKKYVIDDSHLYNYFNIAINIRERVYGGLPKEKDMVEKYVKAKFASEDTTLTEVDLDLKQELKSQILQSLNLHKTIPPIYLMNYLI